MLPSVWVSKGKSIWRNILLEVFCCAPCRQTELVLYQLDSVHVFFFSFFFFFQSRELGKLTRIPDWVWERDVAYLNPSLLPEATASKRESGSFRLLHCSAVPALFPATADHCTLLSAWWQWKNPCLCVGVNMCQAITAVSSSKGNRWGFTARLLVSADLWSSIKNQWSIKCRTWVS